MTLSNIYYLHDIGGKKNQEDYIWPVPGTATAHDKFFIVCDGVGGSENGEVASRIISESVGAGLLKAEGAAITLELVNALLADAIAKLADHAAKNGLSDNMATTFSLLALSDDKAFIAWCGDSRVYHLRQGEILYRTSDHSLVASLVKSGEITEEEAMKHPKKNIILKAIKADDTPVEAEGYLVEDIQHGDYFMLCTDGLLENITNKDLKFLLNQNDKGEIDLVKAFQQFCYDKTRDNYSMYLVKIDREELIGAGKPKKKYGAMIITILILVSLLSAGAYYLTNRRIEPVSVPVGVIPDSLPTQLRTSVAVPLPDTARTFAADSTSKAAIVKIEPSVKNIAKDTIVPMKKVIRKKQDSLKTVVPAPDAGESIQTEKSDTPTIRPPLN